MSGSDYSPPRQLRLYICFLHSRQGLLTLALSGGFFPAKHRKSFPFLATALPLVVLSYYQAPSHHANLQKKTKWPHDQSYYDAFPRLHRSFIRFCIQEVPWDAQTVLESQANASFHKIISQTVFFFEIILHDFLLKIWKYHGKFKLLIR